MKFLFRSIVLTLLFVGLSAAATHKFYATYHGYDYIRFEGTIQMNEGICGQTIGKGTGAGKVIKFNPMRYSSDEPLPTVNYNVTLECSVASGEILGSLQFSYNHSNNGECETVINGYSLKGSWQEGGYHITDCKGHKYGGEPGFCSGVHIKDTRNYCNCSMLLSIATIVVYFVVASVVFTLSLALLLALAGCK